MNWHNVRWDDAALDGLADGEPDDGCLPDFLIIGAAKSGTTSLYYYLRQHPDIGMSVPKEPNFFHRADFRDALDEYRRCFTAAGRVRGESSVEYTYHPFVKGVPERIHSVLPNARLIYVVRDPIDRAEALHHQHYCSHKVGREVEKTFAELDPAKNLYVASSMYALQLKQYLQFFARSSILIVDQEALRFKREDTLRSVFAFLGVEADFASDRFDSELNTRETKLRMTGAGVRLRGSPVADLVRTKVPASVREAVFEVARRGLMRPAPRTLLPADVRARLADALRDDVAQFRELSGLPFDHWSVGPAERVRS